jgi:hypothetical protein
MTVAGIPAIRTFGAAVCAAGTAAALLTGCGGGSGGSGGAAPAVRQVTATTATTPATATPADTVPYANLTGRQLMEQALKTMKTVPSVTVDLHLVDDKDGPLHITAVVTATHRCAAAFRVKGHNARIIRTGPAFYLKGDAGFWKIEGAGKDPATLARIASKWLKVPATGKILRDFNEFCDVGTLLDSITAAGAPGNTYAKGGPVTYQGHGVVPVNETNPGGRTDVYVATGRTPYVVRAWDPDDSATSATFTGFGEQPRISAPPPAEILDLSRFANADGFSI